MFNPFKPRRKRWRTPGGTVYSLYADMMRQPHLLIAGATGSGKSVIINGIICTALHRSPASIGLILIDPKRVELAQWAGVPHCLHYASEPADMVPALKYALALVEDRFARMQRAGLRKYEGADVYVIIDELADLICTQKRAVLPLLQRLCQIGRAARVHVIAATQCPVSAVIPTPIKVNFDSRVGLHTRSAQDSRNILGIKGCEALPRFGCAYYMSPEEITLYHNVPMIPDADISMLCRYWMSSKCIA